MERLESAVENGDIDMVNKILSPLGSNPTTYSIKTRAYIDDALFLATIYSTYDKKDNYTKIVWALLNKGARLTESNREMIKANDAFNVSLKSYVTQLGGTQKVSKN
jgi:hypothetical protein